jgi:hypothetical protein
MLTVAQVEAVTESAISHYGPYAFGVCVVVVLLTLIAWMSQRAWIGVVKPALELLSQISKSFGEATSNIKATTESQERMSKSLEDTIRRAESQHARVEALLNHAGIVAGGQA